jgi:hypothetical protein
MILFQVKAQDANGFLFRNIDESQFYETQWRYTYTLHLESKTIVHNGNDNFEAYYYFRLDHNFETNVNKVSSSSSWKINGAKLYVPALNQDTLLIVSISNDRLVLEKKNTNGKGTLQYHYDKLDNKVRMFSTPSYLLPEVDIVKKPINTKNKGKSSWLKNFWNWIWGNDAVAENKPEPIFINIEMVGGGFFGGLDPPIKNYIQIKTNGRLIREFETQYHGLVKTNKNISRVELESFADYILAKGFFNLTPIYDCLDPQCNARLSKKPTPIPLRLSVTYGNRHKVITIPIFGLDETNHKYLSYPPLIDEMVDVLSRMANRLE